MKVRANTLVYTGQNGKPFLSEGEVGDVKQTVAKSLEERGAVSIIREAAPEPELKPKSRRKRKDVEEVEAE